MARRRSIEVRESFEELAQLREYYADTSNEPFIHLLQLLKEDQTRTITECAEKCGLSKRKAERVWKAYREGGVTQMLGRKSSSSGGHDASDTVGESQNESSAVVALNQTGKVLATSDFAEAVRRLRELLYGLCHDIDYLAIRISMVTDIDERRIRTGVTHMVLPDNSTSTNIATLNSTLSSHESFLQHGAQSGIDLSIYQDHPDIVEIYSLGQDRLETKNDFPVATLYLFRKKGREPISFASLQKIECLRPFLSSIIERIRVESSHSGVPVKWIQAALDRMTSKYGFTMTQRQVLLLSMIGKSYQQTADAMSVSVSTIKSHLQAIYRILGVSSRGEAFAHILGLDDSDSV